jgi:hypothetical protein
MSRGLVNNMLTMNNLGDGSTLSLDFTTMGGVLDPRLTFTRSTTATYINSSGYVTSAAINAPRFDYSPTNIGEPRGLLIEGQAVNIVKYSNAFTSGDWYLGGTPATLTSNYAVGPDGITGSAWRFTGALSNSVFATPVANGAAAHVVSIYAKSNTGSNQTFTIYNGSSGTTCTATSVWQRFVVPVAGTWGYAYFGTLGTNQDILIWGAQSELGTSGASSYIPTGASQVTRNADSCLMSGTNFSSWFNNTEGTCLFVGDNLFVPAASNFATNWALISAANSLRINNYTRHTSGRLGASARDSGGTALTFDSPTASPTNITTTAVYKTAFALKTNDFAYSVNGNTVGLGDGNGVFETVTSIEFARDGIRNGHMKQFKFYPTRLTNAQLQALTAL